MPAFWLRRLPELLASPVPPPVKHSIRATGMASYGTLTGDLAIQTEACRWYAKALHSLHNLLRSRNQRDADTEDIICAPIMMCHFEMMAGTSPVAWMQHVEAAASMLVIQGPGNFCLGSEHEIFLTVRVFMVRILFMLNIRPPPAV